ncbi:hypothetical protein [Bordetella sp. 2513F-2]
MWLLACCLVLTGLDAVILQLLPRSSSDAPGRLLLVMLINLVVALGAVCAIVGAARAHSLALSGLRWLTLIMLAASAGVALLGLRAGLFWMFPAAAMVGALSMWLALHSRGFCRWGAHQLAERKARAGHAMRDT